MRKLQRCLFFRAVAGMLAALLTSSILAGPLAAQQTVPPENPPTTPPSVQESSSPPAQSGGDCMTAMMDGEREGRGNPLWILAGAGCGILGAGAAYLYKPTPPMYRLMGKPSQYVLCYTESYQKKARKANTAWACGGWLAFIVIYAAAGGFSTSSSD
jgi:hypothetical protein